MLEQLGQNTVDLKYGGSNKVSLCVDFDREALFLQRPDSLAVVSDFLLSHDDVLALASRDFFAASIASSILVQSFDVSVFSFASR